jgi:hypothetical protein
MVVVREPLENRQEKSGTDTNHKHTVTCRVARVTIKTGSSSDDWIYWHFGYSLP